MEPQEELLQDMIDNPIEFVIDLEDPDFANVKFTTLISNDGTVALTLNRQLLEETDVEGIFEMRETNEIIGEI